MSLSQDMSRSKSNLREHSEIEIEDSRINK